MTCVNSGAESAYPSGAPVLRGANRKYYFKQENLQLVNERVIFKLKTDELNNIKVDLMKIHKHVCFK